MVTSEANAGAHSACFSVGCGQPTPGKRTTISCKKVQYPCGSNLDGTTMMCTKTVCKTDWGYSGSLAGYSLY